MIELQHHTVRRVCAVFLSCVALGTWPESPSLADTVMMMEYERARFIERSRQPSTATRTTNTARLDRQ